MSRDRKVHGGRAVVWTLGMLLGVLLAVVQPLQATGDIQRTPALCCDGNACNNLPPYVGNLSALIIGVDEYREGQTGLPPLQNAGKDAVTMADVLSRQGFTVRCLKNIGQQKMHDEMTLLATHIRNFDNDPANQNDSRQRLAVVFFAGHGFGTRSDNYILASPQDGTPSLGTMSVPLSWIATTFKQGASGNYPLLFIFDACRADLGDYLRHADVSHATSSFQNVLQQSGQFPDVVIFSTSLGNVAHDSLRSANITENGLFVSRYAMLLDYKSLTLNDTYLYTRRSMLSMKHKGVKQEPYTSGDRNFETALAWRQNIRPPSVCEQQVSPFLQSGLGCEGNNSREGQCARDICIARKRLVRYDPSVQQCLRGVFEHLIADLEALCASSEMQGLEGSEIPRISDGARERILAGTLASLVRNQERSPDTQRTIAAVSIQQLEVLTPTQQFQATQNARDVLLKRPAPGMSDIAAPFDIVIPPQADVKLRTTPNSGATIMRKVDAGARLVVDCRTIACTNDWAGVRLETEGDVFRGWLPAQEVVALALARDADSDISLTYRSDRWEPTPESRVLLASRIQEAGRQRRLSAKVIVSQNGSGVEDEMRAEARIVHLRSLLEKSGVLSDNIGVVIQTGAPDRRTENAVVRLLVLPATDLRTP